MLGCSRQASSFGLQSSQAIPYLSLVCPTCLKLSKLEVLQCLYKTLLRSTIYRKKNEYKVKIFGD